MYKSYKLIATTSVAIALLSGCSAKQAPVSTPMSSGQTAPTEIATIVNVDSGDFGYGTTATKKQIAGWDIDVRPDGKGLPVGKGTADQGEDIYGTQCAACHGYFGEGANRWPVLAGGQGTIAGHEPHKTVGSYWPFTSTLFDYINRAMPYFAPQSLKPDEVYSIVAYILNLNEIIESDYEVNQDNLAKIRLPNEKNFYPKEGNYLEDPRKNDIKNTRCMSDCAESVKVVESIKGVSPDQDKSRGEI